MKYIFFILVFALCSCAKNLDESSVDVMVAKKSLEYLFLKCKENNGFYSGKVEYEAPIGTKHSLCNENGAYIKYGGFFVEEYGLYMPRKGVSVIESNNTDPSYSNISGAVYSYRIRG